MLDFSRLKTHFKEKLRVRNHKYVPNRTCYRYVLNALKKRGMAPEFLREFMRHVIRFIMK